MMFFVLSFFPRHVLDEILDLIESVSGGGGGSWLLLHIRAVVFVLCGDPKTLPLYSVNALIIPVSSGTVYSIML